MVSERDTVLASLWPSVIWWRSFFLSTCFLKSRPSTGVKQSFLLDLSKVHFPGSSFLSRDLSLLDDYTKTVLQEIFHSLTMVLKLWDILDCYIRIQTGKEECTTYRNVGRGHLFVPVFHPWSQHWQNFDVTWKHGHNIHVQIKVQLNKRHILSYF